MYPSVPKREATPVDIGLSMSNSSMVSEYSRRQSDCKAIEVIDLEDDSVQENKTNDNSERKYVSLISVFSLLLHWCISQIYTIMVL